MLVACDLIRLLNYYSHLELILSFLLRSIDEKCRIFEQTRSSSVPREQVPASKYLQSYRISLHQSLGQKWFKKLQT
jgi:hypothetical protein